MEGGVVINDEILPPGFRFHPTDEEIIIYYLVNKVIDTNFASPVLGEVDFNTCEPWDLPKKAKMGENEWFFYFQKDRKYSKGKRTNRATKLGYWKATGKDREIYKKGKKSSCLVGMKKTLVFYKGRAPKGERSNWVMHEYRLEGNFSDYNISKTAKEEWVVCRVFHKKSRNETSDHPDVEIPKLEGDIDMPMPPLTDYSFSTPSLAFATKEELGQQEFKANISLSELISNPIPDQNNLLISGPYLDPISDLNPYRQLVPHHYSDPLKEAGHIAADSTIFAPEEDYINITDTYERMCKMGSFSSFNNSDSHGLIRDDLLKPSDDLSPSMPDLDYLWS